MGTAQATDYTENIFIDHVFRTRTWTKPTDILIGLFTSAPTDAGGGTEVTGGSYTRQSLPPSNTNWTATQGGTSGDSTGTSGQVTNAVPVTFPVPTADWGTVTHAVLFDNVGNRIIWDALAAPRTILNADPAPVFGIGQLAITIG